MKMQHHHTLAILLALIAFSVGSQPVLLAEELNPENATSDQTNKQTIEEIIYNHSCTQRFHEENACRIESRLHGMLTHTILKDPHGNQLTMRFFYRQPNPNDSMDESSLQWIQKIGENQSLTAYAGNTRENEAGLYPDKSPDIPKYLYYSEMIPTPSGKIDGAAGITTIIPTRIDIRYNESGKPWHRSIRPDDSTDLTDFYQHFDTHYSNRYKNSVNTLWNTFENAFYTYDTLGRLTSQFWSKGPLMDSRMTTLTYTYQDENVCFDRVSHYYMGKRQWTKQYLPSSDARTLQVQYDHSYANQALWITEEYEGAPELMTYSQENCPEQLIWDIPDAKTEYSKSPKAWKSGAKPVIPGNINISKTKRPKIYSHDAIDDYEYIKTHFYQYRPDPRYSFEPSDYDSLTDKDAAHPGRPFAMDKTPVTQEEFQSLMGFNPSYFAHCGKNCPVENVTWFQALAYCNAKSQKENLESCYVLEGCSDKFESCQSITFPKALDCKGYRLPTDEEWRFMAQKSEKAIQQTAKQLRDTFYAEERAKIGNPKDYDWDVLSELDERTEQKYAENLTNEYNKIAWFNENAGTDYPGCATEEIEIGNHVTTSCLGTHSVASKAADVNGLYDFYGNVFEWIWDWYGYASRSGDSLGADRGVCRIMRGGSVFSYNSTLTGRYCYPPDRGGSVLGFRTVKTSM